MISNLYTRLSLFFLPTVFSWTHLSSAVTNKAQFLLLLGSRGGARPLFAQTAAAIATTSTTNPTAMSTQNCVENPFLDQQGLPKFSRMEPSHLTPAMTHLLQELDANFLSLETELTAASSTGSVHYDHVLPKMEKMQFALGYAWGVASHLNGVKNTDELRQAYEQNQPSVVKALTRFSQSRPIYDALQLIAQNHEPSKNDSPLDFYESQKKRAVDIALRGMKLGGVGLDGEAKERFNQIKLRLAELSTKFGNHVLDATKAFSLTLDSKDDASYEHLMSKVPASARAMWAQAYKVAVEKDSSQTVVADPDKGPWRITLDGPSYIAAMSHLPDRTLREKIYRASVTRASELGNNPELNNIPLIYEILQLKHEMAHLLGFSNYAQQSLASKMAPSVESVQDLARLIAERALPAAIKELDDITTFARAHGGEEYSTTNIEKLAPWDITFWSERLKENKFQMKEEDLRPYFALPNVLNGMFQLVERLFGIQVTKVDLNDESSQEVQVWHPDVSFYHVKDVQSGKHIASFFLDPYSRPSDKRGGAWMDVCIGKSEACNRHIPVAYLTCNGSPPVGAETPSLMTFREVETLFHEFGHGLQHMLTEATVGDVAGISGVEWDAVELPSQFMENFCYDKKTVYGFAKHYQTGEPLPQDMFEKLKEQKNYGAGMMACRQLYFGMMDMELHSNFDTIKAVNGSGESVFDVQRRMAATFIPYSLPLPEDRFLCTFSHIFAGGYSAGYYSYKWAEVMSADAFGAFEEVGLENELSIEEVGRRFRETVLGLGGGVEPMEVFKRFREREPTPDALLRHNGFH